MMLTATREIHLDQELEREIAHEGERRGKSWPAVAVELLGEAIRMRRSPGIAFVDGPAGRRAAVAGTGLDVWEIIATWEAAGRDDEQLHHHYPRLTDTQLRAALAYYELHGEEIDERLERERRWTPERVARELPFSTPRVRGRHRLQDLVARMPEEYVPQEEDWGEPVGREVW